MSRKRMIDPGFFSSPQVASCSRNARLLFIGFWCFADDYGVHHDSPMRLRMECFPGDPDATQEHVAGWIEELVGQGLLSRFQADGQSWLYATGWPKHQKVDHPSTSRNPPPPAPHSREGSRGLARAPRKLGEGSRPIESVESVEENRGKRESTRARTAPQTPPSRAKSSGSTLSLDFKIPDEWKAEAAALREAAHLPPVNLDAEAAKWLAKMEGERVNNPHGAFVAWAVAARAELVNGKTANGGHDAPGDADISGYVAEEPWPQRVAAWRKNPARWRATHYGPPPGEPGCRVPPKFLEPHERRSH